MASTKLLDEPPGPQQLTLPAETTHTVISKDQRSEQRFEVWDQEQEDRHI